MNEPTEVLEDSVYEEHPTQIVMLPNTNYPIVLTQPLIIKPAVKVLMIGGISVVLSQTRLYINYVVLAKTLSQS